MSDSFHYDSDNSWTAEYDPVTPDYFDYIDDPYM